MQLSIGGAFSACSQIQYGLKDNKQLSLQEDLCRYINQGLLSDCRLGLEHQDMDGESAEACRRSAASLQTLSVPVDLSGKRRLSSWRETSTAAHGSWRILPAFPTGLMRPIDSGGLE